MGADPPANQKSDKQPATKQFLRSLKVTKYANPDDVEAAAEGEHGVVVWVAAGCSP
jgi:hypothetical protein